MSTTTTTGTRAEVLHVGQVPGRGVAITVRLHSGKLAPNLVLRARRTGGRWRVRGIAFEPTSAWGAGVRGLLLEPLDGECPLAEGDDLLSEP